MKHILNSAVKFVKITLPFLFLTVFFIGSCKNKNDDEPAKTQDTCGTLSMTYMVDGNQLHYDYSIFLAGVLPIDITIKNFGTNNEFIYLTSISGGTADTTYARECNGWLFTNQDYPLLNTNKTSKSVTAIGDSWTNYNSFDTTTYTVISKNLSITVPAGTFVCDQIIYNSYIAPQMDTLYFNNAVGIVKTVGTSFVQELRSKNF